MSGPMGALERDRPPRLGVVLVEPLPLVRAGLGKLIEGSTGFFVLAETGTAGDALRALERFRHDGAITVVGLGLEGAHDAYWLIRALRERYPSQVVLACGARSDAMSISRALFCGADGFVDKNVEPRVFLASLAEAAAGEIVLAGPPSEWVAEIASGLELRREAEDRLTHREREVLNVAAEGLTAREIADRLGVRERTVTTHLSRIYGKLGVRTRVAAVRAATLSGLVTADASR